MQSKTVLNKMTVSPITISKGQEVRIFFVLSSTKSPTNLLPVASQRPRNSVRFCVNLHHFTGFCEIKKLTLGDTEREATCHPGLVVYYYYIISSVSFPMLTEKPVHIIMEVVLTPSFKIMKVC
jgi:hypothetical protein